VFGGMADRALRSKNWQPLALADEAPVAARNAPEEVSGAPQFEPLIRISWFSILLCLHFVAFGLIPSSFRQF